ncbi:metal-dependent hydrolase [Thalassomonas viridans]|uniref:Metal-dependent hydrolase n=1 Tax=Thalassomonas viridans TaxID=137584 RepID=A0AAF0C9F6_9GAMM|nr:metal-dependent hydrolase [Thalassomonas viridans]WDE07452.1 metal-dependent hydrolase [Thalassomonas viridans]
MDTLTHMLIGAGIAQLLPKSIQRAQIQAFSWQQKAVIGALAGIFPDIDYLLFPLDPLAFLAYWHRTHTHSIFLAPLWAWILALLWRQYKPCRQQTLLLFWISLAGILSHIISDSLTIYGTRWFSPLLNYQISWDLLFVVDIYFTLSILVTLILLILLRHKPFRACACLIPFAYLVLVIVLKSAAYNRLASPEKNLAQTSAPLILVPQPFSPFYWQAIKVADKAFYQAYLKLTDDNLGNKLSQLSGLAFNHLSYRLPGQIHWHRYPLMPDNPDWQTDAEKVWQHEKFSAFRDFTDYPVFYAYHQQAKTSCVWFSDLRYHWPGIVPTFRFGMCKKVGDSWQVVRMKYLSQGQVQKLN